MIPSPDAAMVDILVSVLVVVPVIAWFLRTRIKRCQDWRQDGKKDLVEEDAESRPTSERSGEDTVASDRRSFAPGKDRAFSEVWDPARGPRDSQVRGCFRTSLRCCLTAP